VIPSTVRRRVALYRRLSAAGVRRTSLLLYPLRRRLPPHHQRLDLDSGDSLLAPPGDPLFTMFEEVWVDRRYLPRDWKRVDTPTVVDVGANIGVFTVWAARELGAGRIVAVEPDPEPARQLRDNLALNRIDDVAVLEAALGGERREATLYRRGSAAMNTLFPRDHYGSHFEIGKTVRVLTLDDVFERCNIERCDLLKLDCEGAEYEALFGASPDLLARIHHVVAECHVGLTDHDPDALQGFLEEHGFAVTRFPPLDEEGEHLHASRTP
jgi:FkbM family methyltransferase